MKGVFRLTRHVGALVAIGLALGLPQAGAVINGTPDTTHQNVGLAFIDDRPFTGGFCSGSLISAHEFLTAGHCTAAFDAIPLARRSHLKVTFDQAVSLTPEFAIVAADPISVTGWTTHPDYSFPHNDVGVIHLATDVTGITPIELPTVGFLDQQRSAGQLDGHSFTLVGYGINGTDRSWTSPQANLRWDMQREYGLDQFVALNPDVLHTFGLGCAGDSGGPLFYAEGSNLAVATVSSGPYNCVGPGTSQRLDTESVRDFLEPFTH